MHFMFTALVISISSLTCAYAPAASLSDDSTTLAALQAKADQAPSGNRCLLYAKLVSQMTDLAAQQFHSGDSGRASETLKRIRQYAEKIRKDVANNSKNLKNAELLMQRSSFRLRDVLDEASFEDREALKATLMQLNQVQAQLMTQVFKQ
jgi:hypothetical protein